MFGNHLLPNIAPQHSFHSPPPSPTQLLPPPSSCAPAIAHLGQAGAAHRRAPRTRVTTNSSRHITTRTRLHRCRRPPLDATSPPSMTTYATLPMPRNYRQQRPHATSQPTTTAHAISPPPTTPTRHVTTAHPSQPPRQRQQKPCHVTTAASPLLEGCGRRNQRVGSEKERGSEESREGGTRRQGKR